jgi:hypothetical protein
MESASAQTVTHTSTAPRRLAKTAIHLVIPAQAQVPQTASAARGMLLSRTTFRVLVRLDTSAPQIIARLVTRPVILAVLVLTTSVWVAKVMLLSLDQTLVLVTVVITWTPAAVIATSATIHANHATVLA